MSPKRRPGRGFAKAKAPSKPRQVLNLGSVAERVTERRKFGRLQDALIQPSTMVKYQRALAYFFHFLDAGGLELPSCQDDLDDIVCECIEYMWETGEPRSLCGNLLSSIPFHSRALSGRLKGAWKLHQLWGSSSSSSTFQGCRLCSCIPVLPMGLSQGQHRACAGILPIPENQ